jgi:chromosome partitioning protein
MTRIYALTNHKGGVDKSTSATNIALGIVGILRNAGALNPRVLLVDTDSQAHATLVTTGRNDYGTDDNLYSVLMADRQSASQVLANCIAPSKWDDNLHVLPASPLLELAERELQVQQVRRIVWLTRLQRLPHNTLAVVIDTHPSFSLMTEMTLIASTDAIVPVEPRYLETVGLLRSYLRRSMSGFEAC